MVRCLERETCDIDAPPPVHVRVTRGHPCAKNLQVRFRDDEYDRLAAYAAHRGLPVSTVVRMPVLQAIAPADDFEVGAGSAGERSGRTATQGPQRLKPEALHDIAPTAARLTTAGEYAQIGSEEGG
jgi:hypothetical protein